MSQSQLLSELAHLPRQRALIDDMMSAFADNPHVLAGVLVGSLAGGRGDRVSDADVLFFTQPDCHLTECDVSYTQFEAGKHLIYQLAGEHSAHARFKKYIFDDFTSAEIHCLDIHEPFELFQPFTVLFDKANVIAPRMSDKPAPTHDQFEPFIYGDQGLTWELFDCIKWLSRGKHQLAKAYLQRLGDKLAQAKASEEQ
ncbi:hypothetical protein SAMN04488136_12053 [Vibrio xiamenensis]|uniref:Nucleotidyltransferase domain-containing protein n=1 Tax=Vibrio xiamenensis TaxID=861298 RepID=A0A1G8DLA9_9VIBR|nr:hypothetical protein [Vibrio xiamenensis]SDH58442.1 hypothetical protein SAMN04488136_12053 [Vibrio xiamenensis]